MKMVDFRKTVDEQREQIKQLTTDKERLEKEKQHLNEVVENLSFKVSDLLDVKVAYEQENKILADALKAIIDMDYACSWSFSKDTAIAHHECGKCPLCKAQKALHDAGDVK
jgi:uncharacterized protein YfeS